MSAESIGAREARITGQPTRLPDIDKQAVLEEVRDATSRLRADLFPGAPELSDEQIPEIMFTMQPFGKVWERLMAMSMQLLGPAATLPRREQKLAILRTGWLLQAPYEWGEHGKQARAMGFTAEELETVAAEGSSAACWTPHEAAVLRACEELHADAMLSDATYDALAAEFSVEQIFELLVLVGQFTTVAFFQNALRVPLEAGNPGLAFR